MCTRNTGYFSPPRLISSFYNERLYHPCKCGECAECKEQRRREWNFRLYHEFKSTIERGGYVIMDLLSYDDASLPHISDFVDREIPQSMNFSCFNYKDVQDYLKRLRLKFADGAIRSFVACEYGSDDKYIDWYGRVRQATSRPHYHQLLFVQDGSIAPYDVFKAVNDSWHKGITQLNDRRGFGFILKKYVIRNVSLGASYYVSKYVVKDSPFQATIDRRLSDLIMLDSPSRMRKVVEKGDLCVRENIDADQLECHRNSIETKRFLRKLRYHITQRVYPSEGFGLSFLDEVDHDDLVRTNVVSMPDNRLQRRYLSLPYYYTRKLYQTCVKWHGVKMWKLTDEGKKQRLWKQAREYDLWRQKFSAIKHEFNLDIDVSALTHYVCHQRGRMRGNIIADLDFEDKIKQPNLWITHFNDDDRQKYGGQFLSQKIGYLDDPPDHLERVVDKDYFIAKYVYFDKQKEQFLSKVLSMRYSQSETKDIAYELRRQILANRKDPRGNYQLHLFDGIAP